MKMPRISSKWKMIIKCINFAKKYRRQISLPMTSRPKNTSKRKDSHSRQHHSNLRSHSRSNDKTKQRSTSKNLLRLKSSEHSQEETNYSTNNHHVGTRIGLKKNKGIKETDGTNEYYNHFRGKSKSKGKLQAVLDEQSRVKYMNSVYMHKEQNISVSQGDNESIPVKQKEEVKVNNGIFTKFKLLEKHCGIDANGKILPKEVGKPQVYQHSKHMDSQNTISMFEGEKKKEKKRGRDKNRKDMLKGAKSKKGDERPLEIARIGNVKSSDRCMIKKKGLKEATSPTIAQKYTEDLRFKVQPKKTMPFMQSVSGTSSLKSAKGQTLEQTRNSPNYDVQTPQAKGSQVNFKAIMKEIEEDESTKISHEKLKLIYSSELFRQRNRCIQFLSKLCSNFVMRRQAYSLAVHYFDKYMLIIQKDAPVSQLKLIAMTSLLLAIKMDDGIMSRKVAHEYINRMDSLIASSPSSLDRGRSVKNKEGTSSAGLSRQNSNGSLGKSKGSLNDFGDSKKSRKQQPHHHSKQMASILALQLDMMMKFEFKLVTRSTTYWVQLLTTIWDTYVTNEMTWQQDLLFRGERNKRNISHLFQIVEKVYLYLDVYQYSRPFVVLSAMYLVIRMHLQETKEHQQQRKIYQKYNQNFIRSTNLIFYDKLGVNELFGYFLQELQLNISNLVDCIRFVGKNLDDKMRVFAFNSKNKYVNYKHYDHQLSIYESNIEMYQQVGRNDVLM